MPGADGYEWDVAVSFAGEDRPLVEDVVRRLQQADVRVFYDDDHVSTLWGENLVDLLHAIYSKQARYAVLFVSCHYVAKNWSNHERQSAQERAFTQRSPYILPVRIDDTDIPGMPATVGYLDARHHGPGGIARAVLDKLASIDGAGYVGGVPDGSGDVAALLADRPTGWQCLLFAGLLRQGFAALQAKYHDHTLGYAAPRGSRCADDTELLRYLADSLTALQGIRARFDTVFSAAAQEFVFGAPADPDGIRHLGRRVVEVYEEFLDWAAEVRAVVTMDPSLRRYADLTARFADSPVRELRSFVAKYVTAAEALAAGAPVTSPIALTLTVDEDLRRRHAIALAEYCTSAGVPEE